MIWIKITDMSRPIEPQQIIAVDALGAFRALGLEQHLTPQRSNGVRAMIERIRADAAAV